MARVQTTVTQTAEKKIKYRYECESCGHKTDWIDVKITAAANTTYKGYVYSTDSRVRNNSRLNAKALDNLSTAVKNIEDRLKNGKLVGGIFTKAKCPKCGKKQSWSGASSNNWITVSFTVMFLCAGIGLALFMAINNPSISVLSFFAPVFGCLIPIFIVAYIGTKNATKHRGEIMSKNIESLEIDWIDGRPPVKY